MANVVPPSAARKRRRQQIQDQIRARPRAVAAYLPAFPSAAAEPAEVGELVVEATSNTTLKLKFMGDDEVVRSVSLVLS